MSCDIFAALVSHGSENSQNVQYRLSAGLVFVITTISKPRNHDLLKIGGSKYDPNCVRISQITCKNVIPL